MQLFRRGQQHMLLLLFAPVGCLEASIPQARHGWVDYCAQICGDVALCRPLQPMPEPMDEVVAFPVDFFYGAGENGSEYQLYDWDKITTVVPFEPLNRWIGNLPAYAGFGKVYCEAHRHGAKVLAWNQPGINGTACPTTEIYAWWRSNDPRMYNASAVTEWARATAACIPAAGFDGVMFDAEFTPDGAKGREAVTTAVCKLKQALQLTLPGAPIWFAVGAGALVFDFAAMSEGEQRCVDQWMIMDYCLCRALPTVEGGNPLNERANADIRSVAGAVKHYTTLGIPMERVGTIFPWFGCDFACKDPHCAAVYNDAVFHGPFPLLPEDGTNQSDPNGAWSRNDGSCGSGEYSGPGYAEVMELIPRATGPPILENLSMTKHMIWTNSSGDYHDLWYDDPQTLATKYHAAKSAGMRAIGMWTPDAVRWNRSAAKGMWSAIPAPNKTPRGCVGTQEGRPFVTGNCVAPYPGKEWQHPKIHQSPDCLHLSGWHDVAGALTIPEKGEHHVFQGCPASLAWTHSFSKDLVHWEDRGRGIHTVHETYGGMDSYAEPCSGFVTLDDQGTPCAGFRQCYSYGGTTRLNPKAQMWDVPMELRCATNASLTAWGPPDYIYPVNYYRGLPYDPVRPWIDVDGKWYSAWSADGCNGTTQWGPTSPSDLKKLPCKAGGQLELLVSDALHGEQANWTQLPPLFTTNVTKSGALESPGAILGEFVTPDYFGNLTGDPDDGSTRVVTQNYAAPCPGRICPSTGSVFWVGKQVVGGQFEPFWDKVGAVGHYDYGALSMARTLGSDPNQVSKKGRRVLIGWVGPLNGSPTGFVGSPASQSLARDLSLSDSYELLQAFVPELQQLRQPATFEQTSVTTQQTRSEVVHSMGSLQMELVVAFTFTTKPKSPFGITMLGGMAVALIDCHNTTVPNMGEAPSGCMIAVEDRSVSNSITASGPVLPIGTRTVTMHIIVDHEIVETIVNNRTAMVTYHTNLPSASSTTVTLVGVGVGSGVNGTVTSWSLDAANNLQKP